MPWYNDLRPISDEHKQKYSLVFPDMTTKEKVRCINNILELRKGLDNTIPKKITDENLLVSSWNIKEFGHTTQRLPEAYFYIAEILNRFDLIAIQEVKSSLQDLNIIKKLLGSDWAYQANDITEGSKGNSERSAYLFNTKRLKLAGISGEITLWDKITKNSKIKQLKRTPHITGFKAGWKRMSLINVHLHPDKSKDDVAYRKKEVDLLTTALSHKLKKKRLWTENIILLGDFNFYSPTAKKSYDGEAVKTLEKEGFRQIEALKDVDTNASKTEAYDRMFFNVNEEFLIAKDAAGKEKGGVFDFFQYVYKDEDYKSYKAFMKDDYSGSKDMKIDTNLKSYYSHPWRKNQMSDHFPIWTEIIIDSSERFLEEKRSLLKGE